MNLEITILAIVMIVFGALYAWHKLQGTKEGDLIDMGFGTYIEHEAYKIMMTVYLIVGFLVLLAALNAP